MNKRLSDNLDAQAVQRIGSTQRPANLNIAIDFKKRRPGGFKPQQQRQPSEGQLNQPRVDLNKTVNTMASSKMPNTSPADHAKLMQLLGSMQDQ